MYKVQTQLLANFGASRGQLLEWPHLPFIGQDFLIDSPWPRPPASDWPAADSQATPTLPLQCDVVGPYLALRCGAPIATRGAA